MHIGFFSYNSDYGLPAAELAQAIEERDLDSLWVGEHTHIPAARATHFPGQGDLPKPYYHMCDPFVSLATAAAVTRKIKLGTGVCLVPQHDPIVLAKTVATLDHLSGGRFLFGIGAGWNREEMENHGHEFPRRWKLLRERVEAMKQIWCHEEASFESEFVNFENIISYPKPLQNPHPPVLMGGATELSLKRVVRYCDGWMPIDALLDDPKAMVTKLHQAAEEGDRDPGDFELSAFCQVGKDESKLAGFRDAGFTRAIVALPNREPDEILKFLDGYVGMGPRLG